VFIKNHPSMGFQNYLEAYRQEGRNLLQLASFYGREALGLKKEYPWTAKTVIERHLKELRNNAPEAYELLLFCSLLNGKNIQTSLLKRYFKKHIRDSDLGFHNALTKILETSLIERQTFSGSENK